MDSQLSDRLTTPSARSLRARLSLVAGLIATLAVAVSACGGGGPAKSAAAPVATTTSTAPEVTTPTVIVNGKSVNVPTEEGTKPIFSRIDTGQQVVYTSKGFLPAYLFAATGQPITFTNLTDDPVTVSFLGTGAKSAAIAPGESYSLTTNVLQFQYHASNGDHGKAQIGAFNS
jgi:hypothetical protein